MATSNFHNENSSSIFAVQLQDEWAYEDLISNLTSELSSNPNWIDRVVSDPNELRSFPSTTVGVIERMYQYKDFYVEVCVTPVIRSGYYEGCNLDWNVEFNINGMNAYDTADFSVDDIQYCGGMNRSKAVVYTKLAERKAQKMMNEIVNELETLYSMYSDKLEVVARFSNGETIYSKVA
jgi:hypothetical protein